jgi:hypothetical protein
MHKLDDFIKENAVKVKQMQIPSLPKRKLSGPKETIYQGKLSIIKE